jgi:hypothetical protein
VLERPAAAAELIAHILNDRDLLKHGGSVYGSWLTPRGEQFIEVVGGSGSMKTQRVLSRWGILMIGDIGPILAGCEGMEIRRTSTPLVQFDSKRLTGVTASGRSYRLVGESEPQYALAAFYGLWDVGDNTDVSVVSPAQAVALIGRQGNRPFERSAEEQAQVDQQRLDHLAAQTRMQINVLDIDAETAAGLAGLTMEQMDGLLEADLSRITADAADAAFIRLVDSEWLPAGDEPPGMKP